MFLTARILFLNEEDYIWYVMKSVYDAVDAIVVVEGCIKEYGRTSGRVTSSGLSVDNSKREIERFLKNDDKDKKVRFHQIGWVSTYGDLANSALEFFPKETTHFLNLDADEIYRAEDVLKVRKLFQDFPQLCGVAVERLHFYLDFWTLKKVKKVEELEPTGGTMFRRYYPGEYYPKRSAEHNPQFEGRPLTDYWLPWRSWDLEGGAEEARRKKLDGITLRKRLLQQFHYGWVRREEKMLERVVQTYRRIDAYSRTGAWADKTDDELKELIKMYNPVWTGVLPEGEELVPFEGEHPSVMKSHPFYRLKKEDFGWIN